MEYTRIKRKCLDKRILFEDSDFPPDHSSGLFSREKYKWLRPREISRNPQFFVEGVSRFDVRQGELDDCWLLAAVANLTLNEKLFHAVVPQDNTFGKEYCGLFHFRFWQYGSWTEVVIDDRLPTKNGQLVFMHSTDPSEFWSALLEKAYAKLQGGYDTLQGGRSTEALVDFTGGVAEMHYIKETTSEYLFKIMETAFQRSSLMACSLKPDAYIVEEETREGLVRGHAYSITGIAKVLNNDLKKVSLIRIRNPWGNDVEWKGPWSDESREWRSIPTRKREQLEQRVKADGEFWMSFEDFKKHWDQLEICNLSAHSLDEDKDGRLWKMNTFEGSWIRGITAGGCKNYIASHASNPQYTIQLESSDENDDQGNCTILVSLMQKNLRAERKLGKKYWGIGFALYELPPDSPGKKPLTASFIRVTPSAARSPTFYTMREVTCRFSLKPGKYVIVPSTFEPNQEAEFILRAFTESRAEMRENDEELEAEQVEDIMMGRVMEHVNVEKLFKVAAGADKKVDWRELKTIMDKAMEGELNSPGFSSEVCKLMVAKADADFSGQLELDEFSNLWRSVCIWKNVFKKYDVDNSGYLDSFELRQVLASVGYHVTNVILITVIHRYGNESGKIFFDNFIMLALQIRSMLRKTPRV